MVMDYLQKAWEAYKKNAVQFIVLLFLSIIAIVAIVFITMIPIIGSLAYSFEGLGDNPLPEEVLTTLASQVGAIPSLLVAFFIIMLVGTAMEIALVQMSYESIKGESKLESAIPSIGKYFFISIIAGFLTALVLLVPFGIVVGGAFALLGVGGIGVLLLAYIFLIIASIYLRFYMHAIVIDNKGAWGSLKFSYNTVKGHFMELMGLFIVHMGILIVVAILDFIIPVVSLVSTFVVTPVFLIAYTMYYLKNRPTATRYTKLTARKIIKRKSVRKPAKKKVIKRKSAKAKRKPKRKTTRRR
jgi:hypothetical protein